jgi:HTH-type transcriptional regulator / antitoxin HipB
MDDIQILRNSKTFSEYLNGKYGEKGTEARENFEAKAMAFYVCEMLKTERESGNITQLELKP